MSRLFILLATLAVVTSAQAGIVVDTITDAKASLDKSACDSLIGECGLATAADLAAVNATAQATAVLAQATAAQVALLYRAYTGVVGVTTECKGTWATDCTTANTPATPFTPTNGTSGVCAPDPVAGRVSCQAVCPLGYIPIQNACTMPNANTPGKNVSNIENFIGFIDFGAGLSKGILGSTYCTAAYKTDARVQGDYDYRIKSTVICSPVPLGPFDEDSVKAVGKYQGRGD